MTTLRWWLTPRCATEAPRHTTDYWLARGVGVPPVVLSELDQAMLRLGASFQAFGRQLGEALRPVVVSATAAFQQLADALAPMADAHAVMFCNAAGHTVLAGTGHCACGQL
jgi:hypothetical protein